MPQRDAAVAGQFYSSNPQEIKNQLWSFFANTEKKEHSSKIVIAPHAGYIYSGQTAAHAYSALKKVSTYVILSPNHTGIGPEISIYPEGKWMTPIGGIEVDENLSGRIASQLGIERDELAHISEHSIEVQLPILQFAFKKDFKIVAITLTENRLNELKKLGNALNECISTYEEETAVIISSDFNHFQPLEDTKRKDQEAIKLIEKLDSNGFYNLVREKRMSICGFAGIVAGIEYCKKTAIEKGKLLYYDTSATVTGDESSVVGYAAIKFE